MMQISSPVHLDSSAAAQKSLVNDGFFSCYCLRVAAN